MSKKVSKLLKCGMSVLMAVSLVACAGGGNGGNGGQEAADAQYTRADDDDVYEAALSEFEEAQTAAKQAATVDERFVLFAQAEAALLDSAVMIPTTTQGGAYTISRIAPRTVPYVQWGNDEDRLKGLVISDEFLTPAERDDLFAQWNAAVAGEGTYDPAAYLISKGHTIQNTYTTTFSTAPVTFDWLNTSSQSDTEITVNTVDGLVEYNNLNQMTPALAESWEVSEDGTVYTFHIRPGVYWYTSEGQQYAEVKAQDFVAGFRHMLDAQAGLEWLVDGIIVGATDYYANGGSFDDVGYKAVDDYNTQIREIVSRKQAEGKPIAQADINSVLTKADLLDGVHPSAAGYEKMGNYWYGKLTEFIDNKSGTTTESDSETETEAVPVVPESVPGDVNLDNTVNLQDIVLLQKYLLGKASLTSTAFYHQADLNQDEKVNIYDLILLKKQLLKDVIFIDDPLV